MGSFTFKRIYALLSKLPELPAIKYLCESRDKGINEMLKDLKSVLSWHIKLMVIY